jgi:hypothetical protein
MSKTVPAQSYRLIGAGAAQNSAISGPAGELVNTSLPSLGRCPERPESGPIEATAVLLHQFNKIPVRPGLTGPKQICLSGV